MNDLNEPQREAVEHGDGPLLVFAGAGSGKTRVITYRTASLIRRGVGPDRILLVTFTNKAASEICERVAGIVGKTVAKRIWAGTFHSIGARLLRPLHALFGRRRDFVIYDDNDQATVVKQIIGELKLDKKRWNADSLSSRISDAKQKAWLPGDIPIVDKETETFVDIWRRYDEWLESCNAVDFEDLILITMRLAEGENEVGTKLRRMFHHVLVDEFQDTNSTQFRMVKALASTKNVCAVGDDDQNVYSWRGADVRFIRGFSEHYPGVRVVKLEQNYRSTGNIVDSAKSVISKGQGRVEKNLWTASGSGDKVQVVEVVTDKDEGRFVVKRIKEVMLAGAKPADVAVLYRSHVQARCIEEQLRDAVIPYKIIGGHKFYDRKEVKDVVAYMRLIQNPNSDVDLLRVINVPPRGIGATTTKRLGEISSSRKISLWNGLSPASCAEDLRENERGRLRAFRDMVEGFRLTSDMDRPSELAARLVDGIGYKKMYQDEASECEKVGKHSEARDAMHRADTVDDVIKAIASYEKRSSDVGEVPSLHGYLQMVSLFTDGDNSVGNQVSLMTVHASKGLEFEHVCIVGFEDGRFPSSMAAADPLQLEEERRLAYVAITRARKTLSISSAQQRFIYGRTEFHAPSRFLKDIPETTSVVIDMTCENGE